MLITAEFWGADRKWFSLIQGNVLSFWNMVAALETDKTVQDTHLLLVTYSVIGKADWKKR